MTAKGGSPARQLLSVVQAAEYTGLSVHTVYRMVSQRRIPYVKVGRLMKFDVRLLDQWLERQTVMPLPDRVA